MRALALVACLSLAAAEDGIVPGEAAPAAPAEPVALVFTWDHYRSVAVVGDGVGQRRPAWIGTWDASVTSTPVPASAQVLIGLFGYDLAPQPPPLAVAYRALAWRDAQGRLHLVARGAALAGPMAAEWSPDSFVIEGTRVSSEDDQQSRQEGTVIETAAPPGDRYQELLLQVQVLCGDGI